MADNYVVVVGGLKALEDIEELAPAVIQAARRAVNKATSQGKTKAANEIRRQINFPARYLSGEDGRLKIKKRPSDADLEGIIEGRHRPTSLARFSSGSADPKKRGGVRLEVKPGVARFIKGAFLFKLRSGSNSLDTRHNLGLALRVKKGSVPKSAYKPIEIAPGLFLLYGPSIDQVFGRDAGVANKISPAIMDILEEEFWRNMNL